MKRPFRPSIAGNAAIAGRNLGPRFRETDIKHICKSSGLQPKPFAAQYLEQDPDGVGYILKELPCPFLAEDGSCSEYENRTLSCREFPPHPLQQHSAKTRWARARCPVLPRGLFDLRDDHSGLLTTLFRSRE